MKTIALLALVASPFVVGCSFSSSNDSSSLPPTLHSANLETNQMRASFSAQSGDSNVKVYASVFNVDSSNNLVGITLDAGDYFTASVEGSAPITLTAEPQDPSGSTISYTGTLPLATSAEDITVALVRSGNHVSAPKTTIELPTPFAITSSVPATLKAGKSFPVTLSPAPVGGIDMDVTGSCVASTFDGYTAPSLDAYGSGIVDTSQISINGSGCSVDLFFDTLGGGTLDSAYAGGLVGFGDVQSEQRRAITLNMTP